MPESLAISGDERWDADLETVWQVRQRTRVESYGAKAAELRREAVELAEAEPDLAAARAASARWYASRAASIALPRGGRLASCGTSTRHVVCGCRTKEVVVGCGDVALCADCRKRYYRKWYRRSCEALSSMSVEGALYLLTLTVPHSGDIEADRKRLSGLWSRLQREARRGVWWGAYALVYEATPGVRGDGHVHAHVVLVSRWIPYADVHRHWRRIVGSDSYHLHFSYRRGVGVKAAARYLSKYASKGVEVTEFSGAKAGEMLVATYGRRKVSASRGFWLASESGCPCCGQCYRVSPGERPEVHPLAKLYAWAERLGVRWSRWGQAQVPLLI